MNESLLSVADAQSIIFSRLISFPTRRVGLDQSLGSILAEKVLAERDQPPFDRVTMDGIAIAQGDFDGGTRSFQIQGIQPAGSPALSLGPAGGCIEAMTGAVLPAGCDTVIAVERIQVDDGVATLEPGYEPVQGQFVHPRGSDYRQDDVLLEPGTRIGVPEIAILAATGKSQVSVAASPRIAIISTGDEVVEVDQPILPHQIRQSNSHAILAALTAAGHEHCQCLHLADDQDTLREKLAKALEENQVLILSGGVSKGKFDFVPGILEELGVAKHVHRVAQRPGKPMWFGTRGKDRMVFALPGNPVSTLVCLHRYVLPAISLAMGATPRPPRQVRLAEAITSGSKLTCFLPVTLTSDSDGQLLGVPRQTNTSGDFASLAGTDGFVELAAENSEFPAGHVADFYPWAG
jgi:molybdopterin molybdotransferase